MLKILIVSFVLLCLGACSAKGSLEASSSSDPIFKCISKQKPLVVEEIEQVAVLTNSDDKTHIHLDSIGGFCDSNIKIRASYAVDTLKLEEYWGENGFNSKCGCILSMDLTIDSIGDNFKYLVYIDVSGTYQITFPVRYEQ